MRVADYICTKLAEIGVTDVYIVTGGGALFLNDAIGREKRFNVVPLHHEQSLAIAAEAYARYCGKPALVNVTTGPGGVNALNGVYGAYTDSVPMFVVSGQVKRETMLRSYDLPLRQLGDQEVDIVDMVKGITKYAITIMDPKDTRKIVEKAIFLALNGRPGPVWIDVPIDVQGAKINLEELEPFVKEEDTDYQAEYGKMIPKPEIELCCKQVLEKLLSAKRPVVLAGGGIRASGQYDEFLSFIKVLGIPVVTGWNAHDLLPNEHELYCGRPGSIGDRAGNFTVQNSDFLLVLGSRLNIRQIGYNWKTFAREAFIAMVDADWAELKKVTLDINLPICADLKDFFAISKNVFANYTKLEEHGKYLAWSKERVSKYSTILPEYREKNSPINPYCAVEKLFANLKINDSIICANGTACVVTFQAADIKLGQRLFTNSGSASMGYDLPAVIGAHFAGSSKANGYSICIAGDGSIMMNLQELATIAGRKLPIKIVLLSNDGYHSIRQSQSNHFPDNIVGCGEDSGLSFPDFEKIAYAFGLKYAKCDSYSNLDDFFVNAFKDNEPMILELMIDKSQQFAPKSAAKKLDDGRIISSPLEDLSPFLSREELKQNMLISLIED